jgi:hypothetical protein
MISGRVAFGGLSLEFGRAKERFVALSKELDALGQHERRLMETQERAFMDLARTYLPELTPGAVALGLTALRQEMDVALEKRDEQRRRLETRLHKLPDEVARRELLLAEAERREEAAAERLAQARRAVSEELQGDEAHASPVAEHRALMERRSALRARRTRLQTTASVERGRYEDDRSFSYLRSRGYGTPRYRAGFITRRLDGWLARRIEYEKLDRNHRILTTGPGIMQVELRDLTDRARELEPVIDRIEQAAGARHDLPGALAAIAGAQEELMEARKSLSEARERYDRLAGEIRAIDANKGQPYMEALRRHRDFLAEQSARELVDLARSTPDPKDDGIVKRLEETQRKLAEAGRQLEALKPRLEAANSQTTGLGELFRRAAEHFTSRRSYFPEGAKLDRLVSEVAEGRSGADAAFAALESSHVARPLLEADDRADLGGWFADLSAEFDRELGAVAVRTGGDDQSLDSGGTTQSNVQVEIEADLDAEIIVYDRHGRVLHRRVTRRA